MGESILEWAIVQATDRRAYPQTRAGNIPTLVTVFLSFAVALPAGVLAHHVAVQAGSDRSFRFSEAICRSCGSVTGNPLSVCPNCGVGPGRVVLTALVTAAVSTGVAWRIGNRWVLPAYLLFVFLTVALFLTDLDHKRIPNRITYPGTPAAAALLYGGALLDGNPGGISPAALGSLVFTVFFFLVFLAARGGFGFGDVKLAVLLGLFLGYLGWERLLVGGFLTALVGGVMALGAVVFARAGAKTEIPYGPAMIIGAWATIIGGQPLVGVFV